MVPRILVKVPSVAVRIEAKKLVEVAWVVVLRSPVKFWRVVEEVKTFDPEKVLLSLRRVEEAVLSTRQVPATAKQPEEILMPLAKVLVLFPVTARLVVVAPVEVNLVTNRLVEVACEVVAFTPVKFWRVVEPFVRSVCAMKAPIEPDCANRLVLEARVAKMLVEVLLVLVLLRSVMFEKVVDDVNTFCPEKVLLLARRVEDAPVIALLQPKEPLV